MSKYIKKTPKKMPQDLLNHWTSVQMIATSFNLMKNAYYPATAAGDTLVKCLAFLQKLHEQQMEEILKHPQCDQLSEIREYKKQIQEMKDGKTEESEDRREATEINGDTEVSHSADTIN